MATPDPEKAILEREKIFLHRLEESPNVFENVQTEETGNGKRRRMSKVRKKRSKELDAPKTIQLFVNRYQDITSKFTKDLLTTYKKDTQQCRLPGGFACRLSTSESTASQADAVVHVPSPRWLDDPLEYRRGQLHVLFQPIPMRKDYKDSYLVASFFDITMTHKTTSTIPILSVCRHNTIKILEEISRNRTARFPNKKRKIASFLSGCRQNGNSHFSDDIIYLSQLMDHIRVDSYGTCFHNTDTPYPLCSRDCNQLIADRYKIVLAFDGQVEEDFVSDAIYMAYRGGAIPVYFGSDSIFELVPGAHTFIHAQQYRSGRELASFLDQILHDDELLDGYLENWNMEKMRKIHQSHCFNGSSPICRLCQNVYDLKY